MSGKRKDILEHVSEYYSKKLSAYGATPRGVDWNGEESQVIRFQQLCKIIDAGRSFAVNDFGCGYGALYSYLDSRYTDFTYAGYDLSQDMIRAAQDRYRERSNAAFAVAESPTLSADYGIASGVFNVRLTCPDARWREYVRTSLDGLDRTTSRAFAFNCLTSYSDKEKMRDYLYYADPCELFDFCKRRYSRDVALLHDYGLYEFTILVRKQS